MYLFDTIRFREHVENFVVTLSSPSTFSSLRDVSFYSRSLEEFSRDLSFLFLGLIE